MFWKFINKNNALRKHEKEEKNPNFQQIKINFEGKIIIYDRINK